MHFRPFYHLKMGGLDSIILDFDDWMITIGIRYIVSVGSPVHDGSCFYDVTEQRVSNLFILSLIIY